ncbi:MAG: hypothetical protein ACRDQ5_24475 [Sciscionella sp.]
MTTRDVLISSNSTDATAVLQSATRNQQVVSMLNTVRAAGLTADHGQAKIATARYDKPGKANPSVNLVEYALSGSVGPVGSAVVVTGPQATVVVAVEKLRDGNIRLWADNNGRKNSGLFTPAGKPVHTTSARPASVAAPDSACTTVCSAACAGAFPIEDLAACIEGCSVTGPGEAICAPLCTIIIALGCAIGCDRLCGICCGG